MKDFVLIFKVLYKNQHAKKQDKGRLSKSNIAALFGFLPMVLLFCIGGGFLATVIPDVKTLSEVSNALVSVAQIFVLFVSMFSVMQTLYNSPDTPFLNTLPVRASSVFFAKFALAYLNTLMMLSVLILPTLLTISIVYAALGRAMFYGYFVLVFLIAAVSPILPLFIITLFSMPMSYLGTYFKGKAVLKTVFSLLFYIAIMTGYLLLVYYLSSEAGDEVSDAVMSQNLLSGLSVFSTVMYPNKVLLDFCLGISAGKNFGIWLAITAGMLALMLLLSSLFYRRINERRLETRSESSHGAASFKQSNIIATLIKKDALQIVRSSQIAMASVANIIICPIITAVMYFISNMQGPAAEGTGLLDQMLKLSYLVLYSLIFLGGTNMMAMLAYTREGRSFYLSKSLPIRAKDSITAKFIIALIPSSVIMIIQIVLGLALYGLNVIDVLLFFICVYLALVGATALHIYSDMRYGNVNWNTGQDMRQVSQGNKGSLFIAFGVIFIGLAAMVSGMVLASFGEVIGGEIVVKAVFWSILFALSAIIFSVGIAVLHLKAEPYFDEIGERQFKPRTSTRKNRSLNGGNMLR